MDPEVTDLEHALFRLGYRWDKTLRRILCVGCGRGIPECPHVKESGFF